MAKILERTAQSSYVFNEKILKQLLEDYCQKKGISLAKGKILLAEDLFVSVDAVNNWMYNRNGPGSLWIVKRIAEWFGVDYHLLLKEKD